MFTKTNTPPSLTASPLAPLCRAVPRDQTNPFLQNKPNFKKAKMRLTRSAISTHDVWTLGAMGQNKPKQSQFHSGRNFSIPCWHETPDSPGTTSTRSGTRPSHALRTVALSVRTTAGVVTNHCFVSAIRPYRHRPSPLTGEGPYGGTSTNAIRTRLPPRAKSRAHLRNLPIAAAQSGQSWW